MAEAGVRLEGAVILFDYVSLYFYLSLTLLGGRNRT